MGRALVIRFGAMGDMVQFSAVLSNLGERHAHVDVLGNGGASAAVLAGAPGLGHVLALSHRRLPAWLNLKNAVDGSWLMVHGAKTRVTTHDPYTRKESS